jgi:hypothetical protein
MSPAERKLLFVFVREALTAGDDAVDTTRQNPAIVQALRAAGHFQGDSNCLGNDAFLEYFSTFPELACPSEVQPWVVSLHATHVRWRAPAGMVVKLMPQERGKAYPALATVFIGRNADLGTWFHELGHLLFPRLMKDEVSSLAAAAKELYPVVSSTTVADALDPVTFNVTALPGGLYLNINRQYCGLDHSGDNEEAFIDEIWAILFSEHCKGVTLRGPLQAMVETIVAGLESPSTDPQNFNSAS